MVKFKFEPRKYLPFEILLESDDNFQPQAAAANGAQLAINCVRFSEQNY